MTHGAARRDAAKGGGARAWAAPGPRGRSAEGGAARRSGCHAATRLTSPRPPRALEPPPSRDRRTTVTPRQRSSPSAPRLAPSAAARVVALAVLALTWPTIVDARAAERPPQVDRDVPEVLSRGVPAELKAALRPRGRRGPHAPGRAARPGIEPREGDGDLSASSSARRGRHVLPPVATRATGPLGLARWDHGVGDQADMRVFPDLHAARRLALAVARGRFRDQGATARGPLGLGTEFELIRDYEPDDDIRQVNWRATARLGRPMSNQYRLEQDRDLLLLIDAGRLSAAPLGDSTA